MLSFYFRFAGVCALFFCYYYHNSFIIYDILHYMFPLGFTKLNYSILFFLFCYSSKLLSFFFLYMCIFYYSFCFVPTFATRSTPFIVSICECFLPFLVRFKIPSKHFFVFVSVLNGILCRFKWVKMWRRAKKTQQIELRAFIRAHKYVSHMCELYIVCVVACPLYALQCLWFYFNFRFSHIFFGSISVFVFGSAFFFVHSVFSYMGLLIIEQAIDYTQRKSYIAFFFLFGMWILVTLFRLFTLYVHLCRIQFSKCSSQIAIWNGCRCQSCVMLVPFTELWLLLM